MDIIRAYSIDRFLLEEFEKKGFKINKKQSRYVKYCFNDFEGLSGVKVLDIK